MHKEFLDSLTAAKRAFDRKIDVATSFKSEKEPEPKDIVLLLNTLRSFLIPKELKKWVLIDNSFRHGAWVLDQVFPVADNPEKFNSSSSIIVVNDMPVQVLGWKEADDLIDEGVKQGLDKQWINTGFSVQAENRGLNLEWHFYEHPPGNRRLT